jgi:hypothetical protein
MIIPDPKKNELDPKKGKPKDGEQPYREHIGSADAFEETENPLSKDADNISDEKLDELLED